MDGAVADAAAAAEGISKDHARQYRDGLMIALLALIPLRRRTAAGLLVGRQLLKAGNSGTSIFRPVIPRTGGRSIVRFPTNCPDASIGTWNGFAVIFPAPTSIMGFGRQKKAVQ